MPSPEVCGSVTGPVALAAGQRVDAHSHWRHYPRPGSHPPGSLAARSPHHSRTRWQKAQLRLVVSVHCCLPEAEVWWGSCTTKHTDAAVTQEVTHPLAAHIHAQVCPASSPGSLLTTAGGSVLTPPSVGLCCRPGLRERTFNTTYCLLPSPKQILNLVYR